MSIRDYSFWQLLPLWTPAVQKERAWVVDQSLLRLRVSIVAISCFAALATSGFLLTATSVSFTAAILPFYLSMTLLCLTILDNWTTERVADVKAVDKYLQNSCDNRKLTVIERIKTRPHAAQLLVKKKKNLDAISDHALLDDIRNFNVFKSLIDHADIKAPWGRDSCYFEKIVHSENLSYLEYVLKNKKVQASDFTPTQQVQIWTHLGSVQAGHLLHTHHFDVNIRDEEGNTPLLKIIKSSQIPSLAKPFIGLDFLSHIKLFLDYGADATEAMQVNTNPELANVLKPYLNLP